MRDLLIAIILFSTISCTNNKNEIIKEYDDSTIKATVVDEKFHGNIDQIFNEKNVWLKSISTNWENGDMKKLIVTDRKNIRHEMKYYETNSADNKSQSYIYYDENDPKFRIWPFDKDFLSFCAEKTFLSTYNLKRSDSIIKIYNAPENSFRLASSPIPVRIKNNEISVTVNKYEIDSLFIIICWLGSIEKTEFEIKINKNVR